MYNQSPNYTALAKEICCQRKKSAIGLIDFHKYQVSKAKQIRASTKPKQRTLAELHTMIVASTAFDLNLSNHTIKVPPRLNENSGDISYNRKTPILAPLPA
jgi:hypothetical protein